jgi:hypothetical protein
MRAAFFSSVAVSFRVMSTAHGMSNHLMFHGEDKDFNFATTTHKSSRLCKLMLRIPPLKFLSSATVLRGVLWLALVYFTILMARITLEYWPIRSDAAFLQIKQQYLGILHWELAFWVHVFTSMLSLVAWLGFVPNLLLVEWLIRRSRQRRRDAR